MIQIILYIDKHVQHVFYQVLVDLLFSTDMPGLFTKFAKAYSLSQTTLLCKKESGVGHNFRYLAFVIVTLSNKYIDKWQQNRFINASVIWYTIWIISFFCIILSDINLNLLCCKGKLFY